MYVQIDNDLSACAHIICGVHRDRLMITNKLKINHSKTEFIAFISPQLRCDLSGLSVNVGESQMTQSLKVRD